MTWLVTIVAGWLGPRFGKYAEPIILLLFVGLVWFAIHLWGIHRYNEGVSATDAKWQAAGEKLKTDAHKAGTKADVAATTRTVDHIQKAAKEQEAVTTAEAEGKSPLDVLFGN